MFQCTRCGLCCKNLALNKLYADLDRGDGICRYLDISNDLCSIYNKRPLMCNVDRFYREILKETMSIDDYYKKNYMVCKTLREPLKTPLQNHFHE